MPLNFLPGSGSGGGSSYKGTWQAGDYAVGDYVLHATNFYVCKATRTSADTGNPATDTGSWVRIDAGAGGASVTVFKGPWVSGNAYAVGDIITYAGEFYICKTARTTQATIPTSDAEWVLLSHDLRKATMLEAERGTDNTAYMTALRTWEAINLSRRGSRVSYWARITKGSSAPAAGQLDYDVLTATLRINFTDGEGTDRETVLDEVDAHSVIYLVGGGKEIGFRITGSTKPGANPTYFVWTVNRLPGYSASDMPPNGNLDLHVSPVHAPGIWPGLLKATNRPTSTLRLYVAHADDPENVGTWIAIPSGGGSGTDTTVFKGNWSSGTAYAVGSVVRHSSNFYMAATARQTTDTTAPNADAQWELLSQDLTKATQAQAQAMTDDAAYMTAVRTKDSIDRYIKGGSLGSWDRIAYTNNTTWPTAGKLAISTYTTSVGAFLMINWVNKAGTDRRNPIYDSWGAEAGHHIYIAGGSREIGFVIDDDGAAANLPAKASGVYVRLLPGYTFADDMPVVGEVTLSPSPIKINPARPRNMVATNEPSATNRLYAADITNPLTTGAWIPVPSGGGGSTNYKGDWAMATAYAVGDVVLDSSVFYQCLTARTTAHTMAPRNDSAWIRLNPPADGAIGTAQLANAAVTAAKASIATKAEAEAGTDSTKLVTPERVKQAIEKLAATPTALAAVKAILLSWFDYEGNPGDRSDVTVDAASGTGWDSTNNRFVVANESAQGKISVENANIDWNNFYLEADLEIKNTLRWAINLWFGRDTAPSNVASWQNEGWLVWLSRITGTGTPYNLDGKWVMFIVAGKKPANTSGNDLPASQMKAFNGAKIESSTTLSGRTLIVTPFKGPRRRVAFSKRGRILQVYVDGVLMVEITLTSNQAELGDGGVIQQQFQTIGAGTQLYWRSQGRQYPAVPANTFDANGLIYRPNTYILSTERKRFRMGTASGFPSGRTPAALWVNGTRHTLSLVGIYYWTAALTDDLMTDTAVNYVVNTKIELDDGSFLEDDARQKFGLAGDGGNSSDENSQEGYRAFCYAFAAGVPIIDRIAEAFRVREYRPPPTDGEFDFQYDGNAPLWVPKSGTPNWGEVVIPNRYVDVDDVSVHTYVLPQAEEEGTGTATYTLFTVASDGTETAVSTSTQALTLWWNQSTRTISVPVGMPASTTLLRYKLTDSSSPAVTISQDFNLVVSSNTMPYS